MRHQNELKQIEARLRGEAQVERENREIRLERSRVEAREHRETILQSIQTAGSVIGVGLDAFLGDRNKVVTAVGATTVLAAGVYGAKYGLGTLARYVESLIGKPKLVRETSRLNTVDLIWHPIQVLMVLMVVNIPVRLSRNRSIAPATH